MQIFQIKEKGIITPESMIRTVVDLISFFLIMAISIYIPFIFAFEIDTNSGLILYFEFILDIWFMLELLLNFFTAYYEKGVLITDRKKIVKRYLKTWFMVDLCSSVPFSFIVVGMKDEGSSAAALKSAKLIRIFRLAKYARLIRLIRFLKLNKLL